MSDKDSKLPQGRFGRLFGMARAGAGALLGSDEAAAKAAAEVLGRLRGVAAKVGQMAAYVDGAVPEGQRDNYEKWMKRLYAEAPRSSAAAVRAEIERELGAPVAELYSEFEDEPIASASIGQVHRARTTDGVAVAVKVQHPGIAEAMEADLQNAGLIEGAFAMLGTRKFESKRILEEIRARFREELDYNLEAERQRRYGELFEDDPTIRVPRVFDALSRKRVLTTELVSGDPLEVAMTRSEAERRAYCETLWRYVYKGSLVGGLFNADPHPGNYFFGPGGQVTFLDYGCIQTQPEERAEIARRMHRAALLGDEPAFYQCARELLLTEGGIYEERALAYVRRAFSPQLESPFRITREFTAGLLDQMKNIALESRKRKDDKFVPMPPGMFFMNRLQFGFYSVLARLDVAVDYAAIERAFMF